MKIQEIIVEQQINEVLPAVGVAVLAGLQAIWPSGLMRAAMSTLNWYITYEGIKYLTEIIISKGRDPHTITAEEIGEIVMTLIVLYLQKSRLVANTNEVMRNIPKDTIKRVGEFIKQRLPRK